ncbi:MULTISPECIES: transporter substrate-binding domain-containing protein [unclassified Mesorhizobium]|uniref:transporter substrate-binding domain-containing protein n=1 Tax=unclassified Mesorhizobium TaxID=325217 RepID=UPI00241525D8|nr:MULTISPECIES: transporter substrate-binding domain-containing protein [unclassified Mesorhizobium]MDG4889899.1 transporter substrate-binding domain-containing protein [Mesorhizobium sp. WSM4887]MDG4904042.1 transporter substrate-binding domain-containing protein [Mesorhizobium sp. WSM4962]MDG4909069.1 transporter substrate-binding domain-containing protein [Mesorhizobium sp. WSM4898]MDG4921693.1 transporter substrate-binding domain-containing protein [Mesorhizobium sp. WSM4989]
MKLLISAALAAFATVASLPSQAGVLDTVKQRGTLNCGTDNTAPGFGYLNTKTGKMEGLDVDFCRAVAAGVLGDANKVNFVTVTDKSRFTALQTGQVDVVFAHTTVYPVRESAIAIDFLPMNFWDGGGIMVKASSKVAKIDDLAGASFCTTQGSATEAIIADLLKKKGWKSQVLTYENLEKLFGALSSGRCDAMVTDKSALASWRGNSNKPDDFVILPDILAKSPFAGFVVANDSRWRNALRWIVFATIEAEDVGITSDKVDTEAKSADPGIQKFLGVNGTIGADFGLPADFVAQVLKQVGNYGEIYDRNLGPKTPNYLDRKGTPNALSRDGGAMISPPWW